MGTDAPARAGSLLLEEYRVLAARLDRVSADLASLRASCTSSDGCATATVGPTGELIGLSLDPDMAAELGAETIARRVLEAARQAADEARARRLEAVDVLLPDHLRDLVASVGRNR